MTFLLARKRSLEVFTHSFRHFSEALHNKELVGDLLGLSVILAHESAELSARSLTGKFEAGFQDLFEHAFSHALGKPIFSEGKEKKTRFRSIYNSGGLRACKDYYECLAYELTQRMLELTRTRNKLYHEGGHITSFIDVYRFLRDTLAYFILLHGEQDLISTINELSPIFQAWIYLSLGFFYEFEGKGTTDLMSSWNAATEILRKNIYEEPLRFMERLFEGDLTRIDKALSALAPYNLPEIISLIKDRVFTNQYCITNRHYLEEGYIYISENSPHERHVKVALEHLGRKTDIVDMIHSDYKLKIPQESKEALLDFFSGADGFMVKTCMREQLPFEYIISSLRRY